LPITIEALHHIMNKFSFFCLIISMVTIGLKPLIFCCIWCSMAALDGSFSKVVNENICIQTTWASHDGQLFVEDIIWRYNERYWARLAVEQTYATDAYVIAPTSLGEYNAFVDKAHKQCELKTFSDMKSFTYNIFLRSVTTDFQGISISMNQGICQ